MLHDTIPTWGCAGCQHRQGKQGCARLGTATALPAHCATLAPKACPLQHATDKGATLPFSEYAGTSYALAY
jgi:hypothetical protein